MADASHQGDDAPGDVSTEAQPPSCDTTSWLDGLTPGATTIYVAPTTTGTADGSQQHPFTTVQAAVAS